VEPDGKQIVTRVRQYRARLESIERALNLPPAGPPEMSAVPRGVPDGKQIVTRMGTTTARVWGRGDRTRACHPARAYRVCQQRGVDPDGKATSQRVGPHRAWSGIRQRGANLPPWRGIRSLVNNCGVESEGSRSSLRWGLHRAHLGRASGRELVILRGAYGLCRMRRGVPMGKRSSQ